MKNILALCITMTISLISFACGNLIQDAVQEYNDFTGTNKTDVIPLPPPPETGYRHIDFTVPYPDASNGIDWGITWDIHDPSSNDYIYSTISKNSGGMKINANGSRALLRVNYYGRGANYEADSDDAWYHSKLFLFAPDSNTPLLVYEFPFIYHNDWKATLETSPFPDSLPKVNCVDMDSSGRHIVLLYDYELQYYTTDSTTVKWKVNMADLLSDIGEDISEDRTARLKKLVLTDDATHLLIHYQNTYGYSKILVLTKSQNSFKYKYVIEVGSYGMIKEFAIAKDKERIAVITYREEPTPLDYYNHSRILLFENGSLLWEQWFRNENPDIIDPYDNNEPYSEYSDYSAEIAITADGNTVFAGGPGQKILKIDANNGEIFWTHSTYPAYDSDLSYNYWNFAIKDMQISSDGTRLVYVTDTGKIRFFDDTSVNTPTWQSGLITGKNTSLPYDQYPAPNGFEQRFEAYYAGPFVGLSAISSVSMSNDGKIIIANENGDGNYDHRFQHIYALYHGSPKPFQIFTENKPAYEQMVENDSNFVDCRISKDGTYFAAFSTEYWTSDGKIADQPVYRFHVFEISPGIILDVHKELTLSVTRNPLEEILTIATDTETQFATLHMVKPGRPNLFGLYMTHTTEMGDSFIDLCLPWEDKYKSFSYAWNTEEYNGLYSTQEAINWDTPKCLSSLFGILNVIVMKADLYQVAEDPSIAFGYAPVTYLDYDKETYLHLQITDVSK